MRGPQVAGRGVHAGQACTRRSVGAQEAAGAWRPGGGESPAPAQPGRCTRHALGGRAEEGTFLLRVPTGPGRPAAPAPPAPGGSVLAGQPCWHR